MKIFLTYLQWLSYYLCKSVFSCVDIISARQIPLKKYFFTKSPTFTLKKKCCYPPKYSHWSKAMREKRSITRLTSTSDFFSAGQKKLWVHFISFINIFKNTTMLSSWNPNSTNKWIMSVSGAPNESVPHIICSPEESCWLAKIQVFRLAGWEILLLIEVLPGNYWLFLAFQPELAVETLKRLRTTKKKKKKRTPSLSQRVVTNIRRLVRVIALAEKTCFVPVLSLLFGRFGSRDLKARGIPGWEINLISWLGNQPILSSWLGNFLCVLLRKRNR